MNNKTVSFTDCEVLEKLKTQEKEKIAVEDTKKAKQFERKRKRLEKTATKKMCFTTTIIPEGRKANYD